MRPLWVELRGSTIIVEGIPVAHQFPYVTCHVQRPIQAGPRRVAAQWRRPCVTIVGPRVSLAELTACVAVVEAAPVEAVPPGEDPLIGPPRGFLPLRLRRQ